MPLKNSEKWIVTDLEGWRQEGDSHDEDVLSSRAYRGPVVWLQHPVLWRQDWIRGAPAPHHRWLAPHSCGSVVHVGAEKILRRITEIFQEKQVHDGAEHHWSLMWHCEEEHCVAFPLHRLVFCSFFCSIRPEKKQVKNILSFHKKYNLISC